MQYQPETEGPLSFFEDVEAAFETCKEISDQEMLTEVGNMFFDDVPEYFDEVIKDFDTYFMEPVFGEAGQNNVCPPASKLTTSAKQSMVLASASPQKRRRFESISGEAIEPKQHAGLPYVSKAFDTPRHLWTKAKHRRFAAVQRISKKRREGRFGHDKKRSRKAGAKHTKDRTRNPNTGQFVKHTKFTWVSITDIQ